jgi:Flp pilus assembly protein TadD
LRQGLDASPDDPELRRQLAETLWQRGAASEAMSQAADAVRLKPGDASLVVRAGEMALASGQNDEALAKADDAIRIEPHLAGAWALRGRTFRKVDQPTARLPTSSGHSYSTLTTPKFCLSLQRCTTSAATMPGA